MRALFQTSFKSLVPKKETVKNNVRVTINFCKKQCPPVVEKHLSMQVLPITYKQKKTFFTVAILRKLMSRFFSDKVKKLVLCFGIYESSLNLQRGEDQISTTYEK